MNAVAALLAASALIAAGSSAAGAAPNAAKPATQPVLLPSSPLAGATSLQVTETTTATLPTGKRLYTVQTVTESKPNRLLMTLRAIPSGAANQSLTDVARFLSDGSRQYIYISAANEYQVQDAAPITPALTGTDISPAALAAGAARVTLDGKPMLLYKCALTAPDGRSELRKYWIDAATRLPYRTVTYAGSGALARQMPRTDYSGWVLNAPLAASLFNWTPPAGSREHLDPQDALNGIMAPDFTVQDAKGKPVKLSDYRGKVVVLDFWATWCGPCQVALPHVNQVVSRFHGQVVALAVNVWDTKEEFLKWLPGHAQYSSLSFAIDTSDEGHDVASTLYGVVSIPTQFVIGRDGKIVKGFIGYGGPTSELADAIKMAQAK